MVHVVKGTVAAQRKHSSDIEKCLDDCKEKFNQILFGVLNEGNQDAHKMEASIFKQLMKLGFMLMQLFFFIQNKGNNYGKTIETARGIAKRGRTSIKSYFSIFGKMKVTRYFYHIEDVSFAPLDEEDYVVVSFDGKGVPMIKAEAAKIVARQGKGEKKQKKKEVLMGVKYDVNANVRTAKEVADNLVYPDKKEDKKKTGKPAKAQNIRYIASIEKTKRKVMEEIHEQVKDENFSDKPLVCVMDGALHLWALFKDVFKNIENKVLILDIIHDSVDLLASQKNWYNILCIMFEHNAI